MLGTVYHLERNMAMIWTADNYLVRVRKQPHFAVGDTILFTPGDLLQAPSGRRSVLSYRQIGTILASALLGLTILIYSLQSVLTGFFLPPPVVLVTVDINPSVLFAVAADGTVVSAKAQNVDAQTLRLNSLTGQPFAVALASVVNQVTDAGIFDPADGIMDYVVVTTVDLGEHGDTTEDLAGALDQAAVQNRTLSAVNLILVHADETKLDQARTHAVPLGLVALADQTGLDTTGETVRSFFADPEHVQALEVKTAGGQLLQVKAKERQPVQLRTVDPGEITDTLSQEAVSGPPENDGKKAETPAAEKKPETPAATSPAAEKKPETPAATSPAVEKKPETPAATSPAAEKKAETPAVTSPAAEKKAETPAATSPAAEKKDETPAATSPAVEKKDETPAIKSAAADKKPDNQQAPGQAKKQN